MKKINPRVTVHLGAWFLPHLEGLTSSVELSQHELYELAEYTRKARYVGHQGTEFVGRCEVTGQLGELVETVWEVVE